MAAGLLLRGLSPAHAQIGGPYRLTWSVLGDGGLTFSSAAPYELGGTVGRYDASQLSGGPFALKGGFWAPGDAMLVDVGNAGTVLPAAFRVLAVEPNPFRSVAAIAFELPSEQRVGMAVFDLNGDRVRQLLDQVMPAGRHQMLWAGIGDDGRLLPPGVYWILTRAGPWSGVRKAVLLR